MDLIYARNSGGDGRLFWVGTMESADVVPIDAGSIYVGVRFRPGAAVAFLGMPASELTGLDVAARDIWRDTTELEERLDGARSVDVIARVLSSAVERRLPRARDLDGSMVRWAARMLDEHPTRPSGMSLDLGDRQLRRRFRAAVGIGPKHFARIARLKWTLRLAEGAVRPRWAEVAAAAGYHDQAHLIRDFTALTGTTPAAYFRAAR